MAYFPENLLPSRGIRDSLANGWGIFVLEVAHQSDFQPSVGPLGNFCTILDAKTLLAGAPYAFLPKVGNTISLYPRLACPGFDEVKKRRVIQIQHSDGNWLPFSRELKKAICKRLAELQAQPAV